MIRRKKRGFTIALAGCVAITLMGVTALRAPQGLIVDGATYRTAGNAVSSSYQSGRYYQHFSSIELTCDGVTDTLALALSQLGYQEGSSDGAYSGEVAGNKNFTEYNYNHNAGLSSHGYAWCASFCSWALYQSGVTDQAKASAWCRNHEGDKDYIWKEVSCFYWATQLQRFEGYYGLRGSYTPNSGDLIFFNSDGSIGHIGLVVYCDGTNVYTVEGNTSDSAGLEANGGGVYYKSYPLTSTYIHGYGRLPYPRNDDAPKVDYSGKIKTTGQYITNASLTVSNTAGGATVFTIPRFYMFTVTEIAGTYAKIEYDGKTGYATLDDSTLQLSVIEHRELHIDEASIADTCFPAGDTIPLDYQDDPHIVIRGLEEDVRNYYGLEDYANNKDLLLLNGRSWRKWETRFDDNLGTVWVKGLADGGCYLGFDFNGTNRLKLPSQTGDGEYLETIVLKRGFQFINTVSDSDTWESDGLIADGSVVDKVVGTLQDNVILKVKPDGGFEIVGNGTERVEQQGTTQYGVVTGSGVNIRSGPSTLYDSYGQVALQTKLVYLGETSDDWYKVRYNDKDGWISGQYFAVTGYETETVERLITLEGYSLSYLQNVVITDNVWIVKEPALASETETWKVASVGEMYTYLGEMSDRWYKIDYEGEVGWVSSNYSTLSSEYVEIVPNNANWQEEVVPNPPDTSEENSDSADDSTWEDSSSIEDSSADSDCGSSTDSDMSVSDAENATSNENFASDSGNDPQNSVSSGRDSTSFYPQGCFATANGTAVAFGFLVLGVAWIHNKNKKK